MYLHTYCRPGASMTCSCHCDSIPVKSPGFPLDLGACVAIWFDSGQGFSMMGTCWTSRNPEFSLRAAWFFNCMITWLLYCYCSRIWLETSKSLLIVGSGLSQGEVIHSRVVTLSWQSSSTVPVQGGGPRSFGLFFQVVEDCSNLRVKRLSVTI